MSIEETTESRWPDPDLVEIRLADHEAWVKNIKTQLEEGLDYGKVKDAEKDCLFKPGQEKIKIALNLEYNPITIQPIPLPDGSIYMFCCVTAVDKDTGVFRGYGFGGGLIDANMKGNKGAFQANKETKMPDKRAMTDAVINVGLLSAIFTQDMEEYPAEETNGHKGKPAPPLPYKPAPMEGPESPDNNYSPPESDPFSPPDEPSAPLEPRRAALEKELWHYAERFAGDNQSAKCKALFGWLYKQGQIRNPQQWKGRMNTWGMAELKAAVELLKKEKSP